ncbi:hypothetical protein DFQ28_008601 [Apophysomyces sp. BC1034]|nr:hypothetical protein DFQ28_008601 [Apophysomyces sp. BC1034]
MHYTYLESANDFAALDIIKEGGADTVDGLGAVEGPGMDRDELASSEDPWDLKWEQTDMDLLTNCVFLYESVYGHYISCLKDTLDEMDRYPQMKGHYLVMDDVLIHKSEDN